MANFPLSIDQPLEQIMTWILGSASILTWVGVLLCACQSAVFSGLNLALFGLSRLRLEVAAEGGDPAAARVLAIREDSNFLLTTILWGNVMTNVLLTLLVDSVLTGALAFCFSTFGITLFGEILPQAWFSRNALVMGARLAPVIKFYQFVLWPVARPTASLLDLWLGPEAMGYLRERDIRRVIAKHLESDESDLKLREGRGALNFFALDDLRIEREGEAVDPGSVISLPVRVDLPVIPDCRPSRDDPFLQKVEASGKKWVILCDPNEQPLLVLDADDFVRRLYRTPTGFDPYKSCHRPVVVEDPATTIGRVLGKLQVFALTPGDDVIDQDVVLVWHDATRRIITGADLLGFLLRGIVAVRKPIAPTAKRDRDRSDISKDT